jgi:hypothetical protein
MGGVASSAKMGLKKLLDRGDVVKTISETAPAPAAVKQASQSMSEDAAARRRARRGGRALLSEARLNPEQGTGQQTLGSTGIS